MEPAAPHVIELVTNVDDATGEVVGDAMERLMGAGALDAWGTAIVMKKGRPGVMLSVLCEAGDRDRLTAMLMELTGSFGVRVRGWDRVVLERRHETVATAYGPVRMKVGAMGGEDVVAKAEYEDVSAAAREAGVPVREVMGAASAAWRARGGGS